MVGQPTSVAVGAFRDAEETLRAHPFADPRTAPGLAAHPSRDQRLFDLGTALNTFSPTEITRG